MSKQKQIFDPYEDISTKPAVVKKNTIYNKYKSFCYRFSVPFDTNPDPELTKSLYQANINMTAGMFISFAIITSLIVTIFVTFISLIIFLMTDLLAIFALPFITFFICIAGFPFTLYNTISNKNTNIQHEMPFVISYMSVLSSGGSIPVEIIKRVAEEDYGEVSKEFSKVVFRIESLGEDAISAMSHLIQNTSSEVLRMVCIDISNSMQTGGGLRTYLEVKSKELMTMRREAQKAFVESLSIYGEGYLSGVTMLFIMVVLMIVISSALGLDLKIMTARQMFLLFTYFVIPFINIIFLIMVWIKYSGSTI